MTGRGIDQILGNPSDPVLYEGWIQPDLGLVYRLEISAGADPVDGIRLVPFRRRRFRLEHASTDDRSWLHATLDRECRRLGSHVALGADGAMTVEW